MLSSIRRIAGASAVAAALLFALPTSANAVENSDIARPAAMTQSAEAAVAADATPAPRFKTGDAGNLSDLPTVNADERAVRVPAWSYHITSSCSGREGAIRQGANYWGSATETASSGTPVSCVGGYVQGCGGSNVVGCNWGAGQRIELSTMVGDFALLAAHEFGHNWYGHSGTGCASWASQADVMRTTMCS
ncbi:hypothetical protein [Streptomyces sp. NPDC058595]|uniref:hypothetical protein n=1 Tax=unclassified Streptomyces TaxID=2593676 RepID=UPI003656D1A1